MPRISPPVRHEVRAIRSVLLNKGKSIMERVTLRIPEQQIDEVEQMVERGKFPNRSEAIRSAVREMIDEQTDQASPNSWAKV